MNADTNQTGDLGDASAGAIPAIEPEADAVRPWELVSAGRYRPLRIRGSNRGRELG